MNGKSGYNPKIHHRRSIRLKGYDYSRAGLYFITICCQDRVCRFGDVVDGEMILNDAGKSVEKWYFELENKFSDIHCDKMIIMPNHFHCILENVGAVLRVGPDMEMEPDNDHSEIYPNNNQTDIYSNNEHTNQIEGEHTGSPLHRVVQWFKTMTTNEYIRGVKTLGWPPFNGKLWQRNYYEHIIRNEKSYRTISNYIINNPAKWNGDKFYAR